MSEFQIGVACGMAITLCLVWIVGKQRGRE